MAALSVLAVPPNTLQQHLSIAFLGRVLALNAKLTLSYRYHDLADGIGSITSLVLSNSDLERLNFIILLQH